MFIASIAVMFDMDDAAEPAVFHGLSFQPHASADRAIASACKHAAFNIFYKYHRYAPIDEIESKHLSTFAHEVSGSVVPLAVVKDRVNLDYTKAAAIEPNEVLPLVENALDAVREDAIAGHYDAAAARRAG